MDFFAYIKSLFLVHLLIFYVFTVSGLIVCFLMLLASIFIWPISKTLYRKVVINLVYLHWAEFTFIAQWWSGSTCKVFLENLEDEKFIGKENTIIMLNHKYDIDWLMAWMVSERRKMLGSAKIYGKSILKFVPLIGWAWYFTESIFLKREWENDRKVIVDNFKKLLQYPKGYWLTLLLFPEGTRFTKEKHAASMEIARKKGLPELKHHLLPRTKGFVLSMQAAQGKIASVLDVTVGFCDNGVAPTLTNLLHGRALEAQAYIRRLCTDKVPIETEQACADWLHARFKEKDDIYDNFYQNGRYTIGTEYPVKKRCYDLCVFIVWGVVLLIPLFNFISYVLIFGSIMSKCLLLLGIGACSVACRLMIEVSEVSKGSQYGKPSDTKSYNINNNVKVD